MKWIEVEDRLPDTWVRVLVYDHEICDIAAFIDTYNEWRDMNGGILYNVTHWMPLPPDPE